MVLSRIAVGTPAAIQSCMKKQIITLVSILLLSTLAHAKKCTTENVGNSPKGEAMNTTWKYVGDDGAVSVVSVSYTHGKVTGKMNYENSEYALEYNLLGVSASGKLIYDDPNDEEGTWEVPCSMNDQGNVMTTDGQVELILRSSFPAQYK